LVNVVGLGKFSCDIADNFSSNPQYDAYKIDFDLSKTKMTRGLTSHHQLEKIEEKCPSMSYFLKKARGDSHFFLEGRDPSAAASLKVLEGMDYKNTNVFYIHPEELDLSGDIGKNENVAFHVLQEYSRSGLFKNFFIFKTDDVENSIGEVSLINYYKTLKDTISRTVQLVDYFSNTEPVAEIRSNNNPVECIGTYGIVDINKQQEKLFFPLKDIRKKHYYYGINSEELKSDGSLIKKIRNQVNALKGEDTVATYSVHETTYEEPQVIVVAKTSTIQERK